MDAQQAQHTQHSGSVPALSARTVASNINKPSSMSRYNGQAPHGYNEGYNNYDPAADGWTHTGSNDKSRVDFYERDNTRMDYYPTTVRRYVNHCTVLFAVQGIPAVENPLPAGHSQNQHEPPRSGTHSDV